jgi:hypothetical protein
MQDIFFETRWQDALRRQLVQHKPAEGSESRRGRAARGGYRDGPYSRSKAEQGGSSNITVTGETWETAAETSKPKYSRALPVLEKIFKTPRPPKIFACQFSGDTLLSSFFRNI